MQYSTYSFILAALPLTVCGYFGLARFGEETARWFLILLSLALYAWGGWEGLLWLCVSILVNILLMLAMGRWEKGRRGLLVLGVVFHVGLLVAFKYLGFGAEILGRLLGIRFRVPGFVLPLGISFFTFQQISYLVGAFRGQTRENTLAEYLLYITYFPKLLMGPITEQSLLLEQFRQPENRRVNWENLFLGLHQFAIGLAKKVLLADTFALGAAFLHRVEATSMELLLASLCYTFQIYYDFSGYSDMACGFSRMLNIRLPRNFDSPYKAMSIRDFWKRWHMSLTRFFTTYLYIPLGGSRRGFARMAGATMLVFAVSGLWHGANWTFLFWGILNGCLCLLERVTEKRYASLHPAVQWGLTFCVVNALWILFQADSISQWVHVLARILSFENTAVGEEFLRAFLTPEIRLLLTLPGFRTANNYIRGLAMLAFLGLGFFLNLGCENVERTGERVSVFRAVGTALLLALCLSMLSSTVVFVYNRF